MNELQAKQQLLSKLENNDYFVEWGSKVAIIFNKRNKKYRIEETDGTYSLEYDSDYETVKIEINTRGMHEKFERLHLPDKEQVRTFFGEIIKY
jgi:putative aminopeptidase FrvX